MQYYGIEGSSETIRFCEMFDMAFDCLNVRHRRNSADAQREYSSPEDDRLQVRLHEKFSRKSRKLINSCISGSSTFSWHI